MIGSVDREGVIEFTRELVRIESVNRPREGLGEQAAAEAVVARMRSFGWDPVVQEVAPGRPNVICVVEGDRPGPTLMFEGHTDVVTAGDPSAWTHDPFGAEVLDGRLYGRGSADMKSGLAAIVYATRAVQQAGPFPGRVLIGALCDEEEMMIGVKHFVAQGWCEGIDAVISDQTMPGLTGLELAARLTGDGAAIPVILCSGHSDYVDPERLAAAGVEH
ncbi:MAG: M20/M25/M40 family metallo-hydrolase, partial [Acidimicrobiales bacterium]